MTEQQAQSPIDDLFRDTFENLPDSPAESGWDTPSDRVWEHIQTNISKPNKGWGTQTLVLMAALAVAVAVGLYWMLTRPAEIPASQPVVAPIEQPMVTPSPAMENPGENQPVALPKPSTSTGSAKDAQIKPPASRNSTEEQKAKSGDNTAQPLPGSKNTLPPNSTEAKKKKDGSN